jgi:hypothetical protein
MQFFAPDILEQSRGLSTGLTGTGVAVGFLLLLTGWMGHRFWIVLATTLAAGLFGLLSPASGAVPPLVMGLLLAVAAGVLALALVRLVAFAAGGIAVWLLVRALAPPAWDIPLICILGGGLVGLALFRVWTMVLTSFAGTLLMGYCGLSLADALGKLDSVTLAQQRALLLNVCCAGLTLTGLIIQFVIEQRRRRYERLREHRNRLLESEELEHLYQRRWWNFGWGSYRRAS